MATCRTPQLLDLPDELLGAVLRQLSNKKSKRHVFQTCKRLATALLQHVSTISITFPRGFYDSKAASGSSQSESSDFESDFESSGSKSEDQQCIAPFLAHSLLIRQQPLNLTLGADPVLVMELLAAWSDASVPLAASLVVRTLGAVELCPAVDSLSLKFKPADTLLGATREVLPCPWQPAYCAALAASFPSLTHLTLAGLELTSMQLQQLVSHPALHPRLQHLDISDCSIACGKEPDSSSPFTGSRLQGLRLTAEQFVSLCPGPLDLTLTQLAVCEIVDDEHISDLAAAVRVQTSLQQLELCCEERCGHVKLEGMVLPELAHLPNLHTLALTGYEVQQQALDELIPLTQVTRLRVGQIRNLTESRATAPCSWQKLEVDSMDWAAAARLPLHSLTHPLQLKELKESEPRWGSSDGLKGADGMAALLNLWGRSEGAGVTVEDVRLHEDDVDLLIEQCLEPFSDESSSGPCSSPCSSSSHSSKPEGHPVAGVTDCSSGGEEQQGLTTRGQAPARRKALQGLEFSAEWVTISTYPSRGLLAEDTQRALMALFPTSTIRSQAIRVQCTARRGVTRYCERPSPRRGPYHYY
ncbi:hypothetical protein QJQ45_003638 [Haematococcus lacustris]|nr:hypothetical protein QJQ45_003638 [Haematococcus lacustris]